MVSLETPAYSAACVTVNHVLMATSRSAHALSRARLNCVEKSVRSSALTLRASAPEPKRDEDLGASSTTGRLCLLGSRRVRDRGELKRCYGTMRLLVLFSR